MDLSNQLSAMQNHRGESTANILVVDDRPINRECLSALLVHRGYRVMEAGDGNEALQVARDCRPDLVITDILMPGMDGFELFSRLMADGTLATVPVIFYTAAFRHEELATLASVHSNTAVLAKPSEPKVILASVAQALGKELPVNPMAMAGYVAGTDVTESQAINLRLATLLELGLALAGERQPEKLLRLTCRGARDILGMQHVAVGLVDGSGCLRHLETIGLSDGARDALGTQPRDGNFLSAYHPPAEATLIQAIQTPNCQYGWLYLAGRREGPVQTAEGEQIATNLAAQLALTWENLRSQQAVEERERRLADMIETAMDAIITVDDKQRIQIFNTAAEAMFGYRREDMLGQAVDRLIPERFRKLHRRYIGYSQPGSIKHGKRRPVIGFRGLRANGAEFPVEASVSTVQAGGKIFSTIILRDISARLAAEAALRKAHEELEERVRERTEALQQSNLALQTEIREHLQTEAELRRSNDELEQMAYVITHDLQEPLRTVNNFVQLLAHRYKGKLGEEADMFISFAVDGVSRMGDLIRDVLEFARVDGSKKGPAELTDAGSAVDVALANLQQAIRESAAQIHCGRLPVVAVDRQQLSRLFQNLISNALKFRSDASPVIRVSAELNGEEWRFCIQDNGIGIAPAYHQRIFEIFKRLHARTEYPGTGVGLALCKKIVERHGGRIWVESAPDEGSRFWFSLPKVAVPAAIAA